MSTTRKALFTLAALGLTAFAAHPVAAQSTITGLFDTGVSASNVVLTDGTVGDPHYTIISAPSGAITQTRVRTSAGGFPIPPYLGDSTTSAFIGPNSQNASGNFDLTGPVGLYDYRTSFMVSGLADGFLGSATITGQWAADNAGTNILLNGVGTGITSNGFQSYTQFTINATGLKNGANTLDFLVNNTAGVPDNPTALRVDALSASGVTASAAPEPSQIGMLALVAVGLGALVVKTRKRSAAAQSA